ncbi:MAG TPA: hypothetical protein VJU84_21415 [Pyrinomonadaceae bacterium]|nr:hypothetical protein [Pyrinomonadaceae bacterium]
MNLRKNFTQTVTVPEWTVGETSAADSPAAYAIKETQGNKIFIKVKFTVGSNSVTKAEVRAKGGGVLGSLDPQIVNFAGGVSVPASVPFELKHHSIGSGGIKREDITWNWEFRCCGGSAWEPLRTTKHRIYIVLEEPKLPWKQQPVPDTQHPWADALDYACVWAAGKQNRDDAAAAITQAINANLGLVYDNAIGASHYTSGGGALFELTQFLTYLNIGTGLGNIVNCTDCATITTTFSNLVGCDLHASRMGSFFDLTPFRGIGAAGFACPGFGCGFSYHEVAWKGGHGNGDPLFDACLRVDGDTNPWAAPYTEQFPVNIVFSTNPGAPLPLAVPFNAQSYKERLCTNDAGGIGSCNPTGPWPASSNGRRPAK